MSTTRTITRVRIVHPYDLFKGRIGYVVEIIPQHSLSTYVVKFEGHDDRRAYQRNEFKFLKSLRRPRTI